MNQKLRLLVLTGTIFAVLSAIAIAAASPAVTTGSATSVGQSSAVLNGTVNPNGAKTYYKFNWGVTTAYGSSSKSVSAGSGSKVVDVRTTASGLLPGQTYHYQIVALSSAGMVLGADRTFHTAGNPPPAVTTEPATNVGQFSATVTGVIDPSGASTTWLVQYGLSSSYTVQTNSETIPPGSAPVPVSFTLTGLQPGTTFHYRIVAMHSGVVPQDGADATFETLPSPTPVPKIHARTTPRSAHRAPFTFTTSGSVSHPSSETAAQACSGTAAISYFLGNHKVASTVAALEPNCLFVGQVTLRHLPGHGAKDRTVKLKVSIRFLGNGWIAPAISKSETLTLS
jgi:hypothetical protein